MTSNQTSQVGFSKTVDIHDIIKYQKNQTHKAQKSISGIEFFAHTRYVI